MSVLTPCEKRGHRWRVLGFNPAFAGMPDVVYLRCTRCHQTLTAEITDRTIGASET